MKQDKEEYMESRRKIPINYTVRGSRKANIEAEFGEEPETIVKKVDLLEYAKNHLVIREKGVTRSLNPIEIGQVKLIKEALENNEKLQLVKFESGGFTFIKG